MTKESITKGVLFAIIFLFFCGLSCRKKKRDIVLTVENPVLFCDYEIDFKDKIKSDVKYVFNIKYKSLNDSSDWNNGKNRFVYFVYCYTKDKLRTVDIDKQKLDTVYMYPDYFKFSIKINKKGTFYINGFLVDEIFINYQDSLRQNEKRFQISKKIIVE